MRNLRIVHDAVKHLGSGLPVAAATWDPSSDSVVFTQGPTPAQQVIELRSVSASAAGREDASELIASWDAPCPLPDLDCDEILNLHYFSHTEVACLVLAGGDIVNVRRNVEADESKIEIVGSVDEGITAAAWSADEELLAISTRANTLLFMTVDFENLVNVSFSPEDAKLSKHVSVGWGKAETQFKGKRAKALRDPTVPEKVDDGVPSPRDRKQTTISWRGDGAYVAVNSILEDDSRRIIRIYSRDGVLESVTEPVDGLEGALSWRPAGNLIAGVQRLDNEVNIVFFERNGLRHGQFSLRLSKADMDDWASAIELEWNIDSSALAVRYCDRVQIWTMGNYHYYLKQELLEHGSDIMAKTSLPMGFCWHTEGPLRFVSFNKQRSGHMRTNRDVSNGAATNGTHTEDCDDLVNLRTTALTWAVSAGPTLPPNDYGTVAVIDGTNLKITPFRKANVPPPMALHEIKLRHTVMDVAINSSNTRLAALHDRSITLIDLDPEDAGTEPKSITRNPALPYAYTPLQICYQGDRLLITCTNQVTGRVTIYSADGLQSWHTGKHAATLLASGSSSDKATLLCEGSADPGDAEVPSELEQVVSRHLLPTTQSGIVQASVSQVMEHTIIFTLKASGALFANTRQLAKNCTSFLITPAHLIYTTANHLLKFVHLNIAAASLEIPPDEPETDERCRSIERGAKLVTVMPSIYALVLQMPRGNVETIYPRALVLAKVRDNITTRQYRKAFLTCRSQRVDMNILHDYAPEQFLSDVRLVIEQLKSVQYIDLLLAQLSDADVSKILYKETLSLGQDSNYLDPSDLHPIPEQEVVPGKVNRICDAFLSVLETKIDINLQNVITANVCKVPPNIEAGLEVVASLRQKNETQAESALEHMCFLTDVNQVYERALGVYDLDLALMAAQQSQKDPREYLPYLQNLQQMEPLRRKFSIDNDLKRHEKALNHLHALSAFDELQTYTQKHSLYTTALSFYRYNTPEWRILLRLHADHLLTRNRFREAAIAYESLSDLPNALSAYTSAAAWRQSLTIASMIPLPAEELKTLATSLREGAAESKDHAAAATISLDYLSDTPAAIQHLIRAHNPSEALRLAARDSNFLTSTLDPALVEAVASLTELLADCKSQALAQSDRLLEVRRIKREDPLRFLGEGEGRDGGGGGGGGGDIPDDISLAPTGTSVNPSLFTRYSGTGVSGTVGTGVSRKTSKNARREERKRARGKKGSVYEEEYLVNSFERLVTRVNEASAELKELSEVCARRGGELWERGRVLQISMRDVLVLVRERTVVVFEVAKSEVQKEAEEEVNRRPMGGDGVLWDALEGARTRRDPPVVKAFEGLSLLE